MKKQVSFWIATAAAIACCIAVYFFHFNRFLLEDDGLVSLSAALLLLGIPFAVDAIVGILLDANFNGSISDIEMWKVMLPITIVIPIIGIVIIESDLHQKWGIDPIWFIDAQFILPMLVNYLFTLWAIFRKPKIRRRSSSPRTRTAHDLPSPPSSTQSTNWKGLPDGMPHIDLKDM